MKTSCPSCHAVFAIDEKRVPSGGLSIKCPKCKTPFTSHRPKEGEEEKTVAGVLQHKPAASSEGTVVDMRAPDTTVDMPANFQPDGDGKG